MWRSTLLAFLVTTLSCGQRADMLGDGSVQTEAPQVDVALLEWGIRLSTDSIPAGSVTLHLSNVGTHNHQFEMRTEPEGRMLAVVRIDAGKTRNVPLTLAPGRYAIRCGLEDWESTHREWGMEAHLDAFEAP